MEKNGKPPSLSVFWKGHRPTVTGGNVVNHHNMFSIHSDHPGQLNRHRVDEGRQEIGEDKKKKILKERENDKMKETDHKQVCV